MRGNPARAPIDTTAPPISSFFSQRRAETSATSGAMRGNDSAPTNSTKASQLLFIIDTTERTGASWSVLHRACLAIQNECGVQQNAGHKALEFGVLFVRGRGAPAPLCTPTGFTTDPMQLRKWLRGALFDGGPGGPSLLEGLLAAARGDWWRGSNVVRHVVLVTHGEPRPLPASAGGIAGTSCWSPVPEELASSGIVLSVVAPRAMPRLMQLHAAACNALGVSVPPPMPFDEVPELLVASPIMASAAARRPPPASAVGSAATAAAHASCVGSRSAAPLPSPTSTAADQWHRARLVTAPFLSAAAAARSKAQRVEAAATATAAACAAGADGGAVVASGSMAALEFDDDDDMGEGKGYGSVVGAGAGLGGHTSHIHTSLWHGSLTVHNQGGKTHALGLATLYIVGREAATARWVASAATWGSTLPVRVVEPTEEQAVQRAIARDAELGSGAPAAAAGGPQHSGLQSAEAAGVIPSAGPSAVPSVPVLLRVSKRRAAQLFVRLRAQGRMAKIELPATGFAAFLDPSDKGGPPGDTMLRGWIVREPTEAGAASGRRSCTPTQQQQQPLPTTPPPGTLASHGSCASDTSSGGASSGASGASNGARDGASEAQAWSGSGSGAGASGGGSGGASMSSTYSSPLTCAGPSTLEAAAIALKAITSRATRPAAASAAADAPPPPRLASPRVAVAPATTAPLVPRTAPIVPPQTAAQKASATARPRSRDSTKLDHRAAAAVAAADVAASSAASSAASVTGLTVPMEAPPPKRPRAEAPVASSINGASSARAGLASAPSRAPNSALLGATRVMNPALLAATRVTNSRPAARSDARSSASCALGATAALVLTANADAVQKLIAALPDEEYEAHAASATPYNRVLLDELRKRNQ